MKYLIIVIWLMQCFLMDAQQSFTSQKTDAGNVTVENGTQTSFDISLSTPVNKKIHSVKLWLCLETDVSDPSTLFGGSDKAYVKCSLAAKKTGVNVDNVFPAQSFELEINADRSQSFLFQSNSVENGWVIENIDDNLSFDQVEISITEGNLNEYTSDAISLKWNYEITYSIDISDIALTASGVNTETSVLSKTLKFNWLDNLPLNDYEFQLLRLYNQDEQKTDSEENITAIIDWSKASSAYVKAENINNTKSINYTITEGTGFYVWRVRPVSNYYDGGLANLRNRGLWPATPAHGAVVPLGENAQQPYFFFSDPDESRNYNISKMFAEDGKVKELATYANTLQHVRQTTTYLPSENVSVVTQTILDNTGRPALVTMPFPVNNKILSYQEGLVKNEAGELYAAKDFDDESVGNIWNPARVDESNDLSYYYNNGNIANSEGYPFARTIYYNDGSGRVKEQGGVGQTHQVGGNHTTRYIYETASQTELIQLFGPEAPNSRSVFKTITIDPNNVGTVSYTNKEGQVIATGLTFNDATGNQLYDSDLTSFGIDLKVANKLTVNNKVDDAFVSNKRINILYDNTAVSLTYVIEQEVIDEMCLSTVIDCQYEVFFKIYQINEDNTVELKQTLYHDLTADNVFPIIENVELNKGTYIVQKELVSQGMSVDKEENKEKIESQVKPITSYITGLLDFVETAEQLEEFFIELRVIASSINNETLFADYPVMFGQIGNDSPSLFDPEFYENNKQLYSLELFENANNQIALAVLNTPCCGNMEIPINWTPPFDCVYDEDKNEDGVIDHLDWPDFELYAINILAECLKPNVEDDLQVGIDIFYNEYMTGWEPGYFNEMVYHMVNDQYAVGKKSEGGGEIKEQYQCEDLWDCWAGVVNKLRQETKCGSIQSQPTENKSVSEQYEEQQEQDKSDTYDKGHDSHFDSSFKGGFFLTRWIAKRKVSKRMRRLRIGESESVFVPELPKMHLVKEFLDCSGYQFAKMLTYLDAEPLPEDNSGMIYRYDRNSDTRMVTEQNYITPVPFEFNTIDKTEMATMIKGDGTHYFAPVADWDNDSEGVRLIDDNTQKPLFEGITNPIFAFKYLTYEGPGNPEYQMFESQNCLIDPNDCFTKDADEFYNYDIVDGVTFFITEPCNTDSRFQYEYVNYPATGETKIIVDEFCGQGRIICHEYYDNWSGDQRYFFWQMIKGVIPQTPEFKTQIEVTCQDYIEERIWVTNGESFVPEDVWLDPDGLNGEGDYVPATFERITSWDPIVKTTVTGAFSMVEKELQDYKEASLLALQTKRGEVKSKIIQTLLDNCWIIGECRTNAPSTFNVIPEEDIDMLVEQTMIELKGQWEKATEFGSFTCEDIDCRPLDSPLDIKDETEKIIQLQYGMGVNPDGTDNGFTYTTIDFSEDNEEVARNYSRINFEPVDLSQFSWYTYTLLKQLNEWEIDFWIYNWCGQEIASNPPPQSPDKIRENDTWLPKSEYETIHNNLEDANTLQNKPQVKSPYKKVLNTIIEVINN